MMPWHRIRSHNGFQFYTARQKLSLKGEREALSDGSTLSSVGLSEGGELTAKDLGPQIAWQTVFIWEYVSMLCKLGGPEY